MLSRLDAIRQRIKPAALGGFLAGAALCLGLGMLAGTIYGGGLSDHRKPALVYPNL